MTLEPNIPVADRIIRLLQRLGIQKAHFAARSSDWGGLADRYPEVFASLTLLCPGASDLESVRHLDAEVLVFNPDNGKNAENVQQVAAEIPKSTLEPLPGYMIWSDIVVEHLDTIHTALLPFLTRTNHFEYGTFDPNGQGAGEVAGITYQVRGSGPPLVMLPIGLVPSQWDPLIPILSNQFCTITLGGAALGIVATLEMRGRFSGYLGMVRNLIAETGLKHGESVLEVGCGTGVLTRWLARHTQGHNPIMGVDINAYLLREAAAFTNKEGLTEAIVYREGNAEALPFPDDQFDVVFSSTVMEEVDARKMLAEMIRVTRPGGRVAVIVRAIDRPFLVNLPLPDALKAKVEDHSWAAWVAEKGCADASLYRLFNEAALSNVKMFPFLAAFDGPIDWLENSVASILSQDEREIFKSARIQAEKEGTSFFSYPHHCAVGTKKA